MAKLVVKVPGEPVAELDLPPGIHQLGRSPGANFQINHPSVSGSHCQIAVEADGATIKDLGSTNGIWMDGQRIQEKPLLPGQSLRLGEVDVVFDPQAAPPAGLRLTSMPAGAVGAEPPVPPPLQPRLAAVRPVTPPTKTFYQSIPGAFAYPLKGMGFIPLAVGSVLFLAFNLLPILLRLAEYLAVSGGHGQGIRLFFRTVFAGGFFGIGIIFNALCTGYVFLFMQTIISTSANGEDRMPLYPPFESWWYDAVEPYFRLLVLLACCLAPAVLCSSYLGPDAQVFTLVLGFLGFCYFPMALLAVSVCDSMRAMHPRIVIPSICRVPVEYGVYCLLFIVLMVVTVWSPRWIREIPVLLLRFPIYQLLAVQFFFLYISAVEMRLLGLLYHTGRQRLAWKPG
jgi:hypothetical protein